MKLSIITINLNDKSGLSKTIRSVISQTYKNFEYIVIDGGSMDQSIDILKQNSTYLKYWISEPDSGIYNAMNKGIEQSKGDYCFFLNSGDWFVNERVLENVFSRDFNEDVVFGNLLVCINGNIVGKSCGKEKLTFLDVFSSILKHQASFIKRQLFNRFGIYNQELKIVADWEFFIKSVGLGGATYRYLNLDISYFDNNGISNNSEHLISLERKIVLEKYLPPMMQGDYEYLMKYGKYRILTQYYLTDLLLRFLTRLIRRFKKKI